MKQLLLIGVFSLAFAGCLGLGNVGGNGVIVTPVPLIEQVALETPDGWTLTGYYYKPLGPVNKSVVLLHQLGADKSSWADLAPSLQLSGIGVLVIDQRGHGDSFINNTKRRYTSFTPEDYQKMVDDVEGFTLFFKERRPVDRVYLIGASIGGNAALNYAARDSNVSGVAMLSPGLDYRGIGTTATVTQYGNRPLLLLAAKGDEYSAFSARELSSKSPSARTSLQVVEGSAHGTAMLTGRQDLQRDLLQWVLKN